MSYGGNKYLKHRIFCIEGLYLMLMGSKSKPAHKILTRILLPVGFLIVLLISIVLVSEITKAAKYTECNKNPESVIAESDPPICLISGQEAIQASRLFN